MSASAFHQKVLLVHTLQDLFKAKGLELEHHECDRLVESIGDYVMARLNEEIGRQLGR